MRYLRRISMLFMAVVFALALLPAAAQDEETTGTLDDVSQLEGIEAGVSRSWSIDFTAMMEVTPEDGSEDPFASMEGVFFLTAVALEFDSDDNAEAAFDLYRESLTEELERSLEGEELDVSDEEIDGLGDGAHAFDAHTVADDSEGFFRYAIAHEEEYAYLVVSVATTEEATTGADSLLEYLVDEGEASSDDEEFNEEGGSTGGLWEVFPDDDHESLEGLIPGGDEIVYPVPEGEE